MGMLDELKQVQETRKADEKGEKDTSLVDPGPFDDAPLTTPEEKPAEKEAEEEAQEEDGEEEEKAPEVATADEDDISEEKLAAALKKYKTPEEAVKAALRAQRRMSKATEEAANLRRDVDALRRHPVQPQPVVVPKPEIPVEDAIAEKYYTEIERISAEDTDRDKKVIKIMAKMNAEIARENLRSEKTKEAETDRHISTIEARAKEMGLEEKHLDDFWIFASHAPRHLERDAAIQWSLDRINGLRGNLDEVEKQTIEKVKKDEKERKRMTPLAKGVTTRPAQKVEEEKDLSLGDALRHMARQRTYK